jgi:hypothetical protein
VPPCLSSHSSPSVTYFSSHSLLFHSLSKSFVHCPPVHRPRSAIGPCLSLPHLPVRCSILTGSPLSLIHVSQVHVYTPPSPRGDNGRGVRRCRTEDTASRAVDRRGTTEGERTSRRIRLRGRRCLSGVTLLHHIHLIITLSSLGVVAKGGSSGGDVWRGLFDLDGSTSLIHEERAYFYLQNKRTPPCITGCAVYAHDNSSFTTTAYRAKRPHRHGS